LNDTGNPAFINLLNYSHQNVCVNVRREILEDLNDEVAKEDRCRLIRLRFEHFPCEFKNLFSDSHFFDLAGRNPDECSHCACSVKKKVNVIRLKREFQELREDLE
jgi:hypothetical protein